MSGCSFTCRKTTFPADIWTIRGANLCAWEAGLLPELANREIVIDPRNRARRLRRRDRDPKPRALERRAARHLYVWRGRRRRRPAGRSRTARPNGRIQRGTSRPCSCGRIRWACSTRSTISTPRRRRAGRDRRQPDPRARPGRRGGSDHRERHRDAQSKVSASDCRGERQSSADPTEEAAGFPSGRGDGFGRRKPDRHRCARRQSRRPSAGSLLTPDAAGSRR